MSGLSQGGHTGGVAEAGTPSVGPPGTGHAGGPRFALSAKGFLVAAAAIGAVIVAAVVAFFALAPDSPRPTAAQQPPSVGANPGPGAGPVGAQSDGALVRGTYSWHTVVRSRAGTTSSDNVGSATSDCPHCAVTISGDGPSTTYHWNGSGWQMQTDGPICAGDTITLTPTVVANGFVQELSLHYATCNGTVVTATGNRIGD